MQRIIICKSCGLEKPANPKLKGHQNYCGDPKCQQARKAEWQRQKMASDLKYRTGQMECLAKWRKKRPLHQYQRQYRHMHPDYVLKNRQSQKTRNQKRNQTNTSEMIVKMDALTNITSNTYILTPLKIDRFGKIVKMDASLVELALFQKDNWPIVAVSP